MPSGPCVMASRACVPVTMLKVTSPHSAASRGLDIGLHPLEMFLHALARLLGCPRHDGLEDPTVLRHRALGAARDVIDGHQGPPDHVADGSHHVSCDPVARGGYDRQVEAQ